MSTQQRPSWQSEAINREEREIRSYYTALPFPVDAMRRRDLGRRGDHLLNWAILYTELFRDPSQLPLLVGRT